MFNGLSTNGTSLVQIQIGDSGGVETTGYTIVSSSITGTNTCVVNSYTSGIVVSGALSTNSKIGIITLTNINDINWVINGTSTAADTLNSSTIIGSKFLTSSLDRIRVTTVNGTDAFDAGIINISYEG
jgi:hypothetical protein